MIHNARHLWSKLIRFTRIATIASIVIAGTQLTSANPFSDNFDTLITELQNRSQILTNNPTELKQKKAVDKVLAAFAKESTALATDVKNGGKIAKSLIKAFPTEFETSLGAVPTPHAIVNPLNLLLELAFEGLQEDAQTLLDTVQGTLDELDPSSCKDKAQETLDAAQSALDDASTAPDFATWAKLLGTGLKTISKGNSATSSAANCNSGGGGGGGALTATVNGQSHNAAVASGTFLGITGQLSINGPTIGNPIKTINLSIFDVIGTGTYPAGGGTMYQIVGVTQYANNLTGSVTITSLNIGSGTAQGTFWFNATDSSGTNSVTVTNGTFNASGIVSF